MPRFFNFPRLVLVALVILLVAGCRKEAEPQHTGLAPSFLHFTFNAQPEEWTENRLRIGNRFYDHLDSLNVRTLEDNQTGGSEVRLELVAPSDSSDLAQAIAATVGKKQPIGAAFSAAEIGILNFYLHRPNQAGNPTYFSLAANPDTTVFYYRFTRITYAGSDIANAHFLVEGELNALMEPTDGSGVLLPLTNTKFRLYAWARGQ